VQDKLLKPFRHDHDYTPERGDSEKKTRRLVLLTAAMMVFEILAGWRFHSMALLADGWHMSTHVAAFLITAAAYAISRRHRQDSSFCFGTGKIDVLGGYTSAVLLGVVAVFMAAESVLRLFHPLPIHYNESIAIGCLGLCVNVASALLLKHGHGHGDSHGHGHAGEMDLNLKAAYVHILADAVTSLLAITALVAGKFLGWVWMDPVMGIIGSGVVAQWSWVLLRDTSVILIDRTPQTDLKDEIRKAVESEEGTSIVDLHVWQVGVGQFSAIVSIAAENPRTPEYYRKKFKEHAELLHVTIEIHAVPRGVAS